MCSIVQGASEGSTGKLVVFVGFVVFFPGRDQYYRRLFLWVCCSGSTRRLNREEVFGEARDQTFDPWFTRQVT